MSASTDLGSFLSILPSDMYRNGFMELPFGRQLFIMRQSHAGGEEGFLPLLATLLIADACGFECATEAWIGPVEEEEEE